MQIVELALTQVLYAVALLCQKNATSREMASHISSWLNSGAAKPALLCIPSLLESKEPELRHAGICIAGIMKTWCYLARIEKIAADTGETEDARVYAAWAIGRIKQPSSTPLLLDLATNVDSGPALSACCRMSLNCIYDGDTTVICTGSARAQ